MDFSIIASSFALLFLAELGDKTQLMTMTLAQRYRALPVAIGACAAFLVLNLLALAVGQILFDLVPRRALLLVAGLLFLFFAWNAWREATRQAAGDDGLQSGRTAVLASFVLIFVAELGDKTQLALIALVASTGHPWSVFLGATLALWCVSLLSIALGSTLLVRVPRLWLQRGAALLFALFGALALAEAMGVLARLR